jgi:predicted GIY-YIG superfamily endonuclease
VNDKPTSLYRFYDAENRLLYVGITLHVPNRWSDHARGKSWWRDVDHSTVEHFATRAEAAAKELTAIRTEGPLYNIAGATRPLKEIALDTKGPKRSDRLSQAENRPFTIDSLVGTFFLGTFDRSIQGCVVAEPSPGVYLVETFSWIMGESYEQELVPIEAMAGWSFYDSAEWMKNAYEQGVGRRWEQQRAEATGETYNPGDD